MKNRMIIALCICLAVSVTACSRRDNTKEPEISQSQSVSENPSISSEQEEPNSPDFVAPNNQSEPEESQWNPADYPDPTLPENMGGVFYRWEHLEYRTFGQPSQYKTVEVIPTGLEDEEQRIMMSIHLPPVYSFGEYNRIMYDGGFQELLPAGDIVYCDTYDSGKGFVENALHITAQRSADIMLGGGKYDMVEQNVNTPGNYIVTNKFVRCIYSGGTDNHEVIYLIKAMDNAYVAISFLVSAQADTDDLALYDAIAESVRALD